MVRKPYTPGRAYRLSVRPLAIFFVLFAVAFSAAMTLFRDEAIFLPPFEGVAKRAVGIVIGLFVGAIGVGLYLKLKVAWYALFAYIILGTPWMTWAFATAPEPPPVAFLIACPIFNAGLAVGLYFATRPVFARPRDRGRESEPG